MISFFKSYLQFFATIIFFWFLTTFGFALSYIPSESMLPTMKVGDLFLINKYAYGFAKENPSWGYLPDFMTTEIKTPQRGDVINFFTDKTLYIKRVIGLPGDKIQYKNGELHINQKLIERKFIRSFYYETNGDKYLISEYEQDIGTGTFNILEHTDNSLADNTEEFIVPAKHVFVMGDNRDNSSDSRFKMSFIPLEKITGKPYRTIFSANFCIEKNEYGCPGGNFFNSFWKKIQIK